ncbi:MAG: hypothetical protein CL878_13795 [Dehalococcoidia bacterium]|nr:hypothetical protein [Dehalococcoidia bacterium]
MTAFATHFAFEFRTGIRDRNQLLLNYLFPLGMYGLLGVLMTQLNPTFHETMIPVMIILAILSSTVLGLPSPLVEAREAGIWRSYRINGVPAFSILVIPALTTMTHLVLVAALITATAPWFFNAPVPVNWVSFVLVCFVTALACAGLGLLIGVVSSSTQATILWAQLLFLPSMLIGGLMVPAATLPETFGRVGLLLPARHAMQAFEGWAYQQGATLDPLWSVLILLAGGVLAMGLALALFSWDSANPTRRGHPALALLAILPYAVGLAVLAPTVVGA